MKTPKSQAQFTKHIEKLENKKLFSHNPFFDDTINGFDSNNSSDTDRTCECSGAHPKKASVSQQDSDQGFVNGKQIFFSSILFVSYNNSYFYCYLM